MNDENTENMLCGWWAVKFELTLEGENVRMKDLSEVTQEHIFNLISDGYTSGEIIEWEENKQ